MSADPLADFERFVHAHYPEVEGIWTPRQRRIIEGTYAYQRYLLGLAVDRLWAAIKQELRRLLP